MTITAQNLEHLNTDELLKHIREAMHGAIEDATNHRIWLRSEQAKNEEDKSQQFAECDRTVDLSNKVLDLIGRE